MKKKTNQYLYQKIIDQTSYPPREKNRVTKPVKSKQTWKLSSKIVQKKNLNLLKEVGELNLAIFNRVEK